MQKVTPSLPRWMREPVPNESGARTNSDFQLAEGTRLPLSVSGDFGVSPFLGSSQSGSHLDRASAYQSCGPTPANSGPARSRCMGIMGEGLPIFCSAGGGSWPISAVMVSDRWVRLLGLFCRRCGTGATRGKLYTESCAGEQKEILVAIARTPQDCGR
jgi:hypothetical protein